MRVFLSVLLLAASSVPAAEPSPQAGRADHAARTMSQQRLEGLRAGHGLGYARAAELNGFPGPKHVLELADALALSERQRSRTRELFDAMQASAVALGRELIAVEHELDRVFAQRTVTPERLEALVAESARLEGRLRAVHLRAHLEQAELLDRSQVSEYMRLRGHAAEPGKHRRAQQRHRHSPDH